MFVGRLDGIICQQQQQQQNDDDQINSKLTSTFIAFEIEQILEQDTQSSSLLELIGALIKSQFPVLHIRTNMNTFT
jgi:GTP-sensing pleiotropic transcriptional regulator CodY